MRDTIFNILALSKATNWEFRDISDIDSQLTIWGLDNKEIIRVKKIVDYIVTGYCRVSVIRGEDVLKLPESAKTLTFLVNGKPCAYSADYNISSDQTIKLNIAPELVYVNCPIDGYVDADFKDPEESSKDNFTDAMRYMCAGKHAYPMYQEDEESSEPVVKYTEEEFKKKCEDPVFKLASDIERDMYEGVNYSPGDQGPTRFDNGYVELASMSEWLEAKKVQIETNRAIMMHQFSLATATGENLDNIAANMNMPKFEAIGGMGTIEILEIIEPFTTGSGIWTAPKEGKIEVTMSKWSEKIDADRQECRDAFQAAIESSSSIGFKTPIIGSCDHELKHYVSFNGQEEFDYCKKCQEKL